MVMLELLFCVLIGYSIGRVLRLCVEAKRLKDPLYSCAFHTDLGCSFVDGMNCNMDNCTILHRYQIEVMQKELSEKE